MSVKNPLPLNDNPFGNDFISTEIRGLVETKERLEKWAENIHGKPMLDTMHRATLLVTRSAKINLSKPTVGVKFPTVNSGQLRNSITPEVKLSRGNVLQGVVGSNLKQAPFMEFGTGIPAGRPRTTPPIRVLKVWVDQKNRGGKNLNAYVVQRAIYKRGGLMPRKYLQRAFDDNVKEIQEMFEGTVKAIIK